MNTCRFKRTFPTALPVIAFAAILVTTSGGTSGQNKKPPPTARLPVQQIALDWEKLTEQQFKQLPDSQPIMFEGKRSTLGEVRVKARAWQQQMAQKRTAAQAKIVRNKAPSPARSSIDQLLRTQQHKFAAEDTKVQTELKRLRKLGPATAYGKTTTELRVATQKPSGFDTMPPRVTKVFGIIQPGGLVLLGGNNFGDKRGIVRMIVQDASWDLKLEKLEWYPTGIAGRIPNNPALVKGSGARFVVESSSGAKSNEWPVNWVMEIKLLPRKDVRVVSCGDDGNDNQCNSSYSDEGWCFLNYADWVEGGPQDEGSFGGSHTNCWGANGDDSGTDVYQISLKNGWVLAEFDFGSGVSNEDQGWVTGPGVFPVGATSWKPSIAWSVTPDDEVAYWGYIYIRGPKGVPHK